MSSPGENVDRGLNALLLAEWHKAVGRAAIAVGTMGAIVFKLESSLGKTWRTDKPPVASGQKQFLVTLEFKASGTRTVRLAWYSNRGEITEPIRNAQGKVIAHSSFHFSGWTITRNNENNQPTLTPLENEQLHVVGWMDLPEPMPKTRQTVCRSCGHPMTEPSTKNKNVCLTCEAL